MKIKYNHNIYKNKIIKIEMNRIKIAEMSKIVQKFRRIYKEKI